MTKYILIAVVIISLFALVGCVRTTVAVGAHQTYAITSDIKSLDVEINAADFVIEHSDKFSAESNLNNIKVTEKGGVLKIVEKTRNAVNYDGAMLKLYVPEDVLFDNVTITTGAGRLSANSLSANTMTLKSGAGQVEFGNLDVKNSIKIKGGAGQINILHGTLNNMSLDLGVGELNMTAQLLGESNLKFGVGESNLTLIGSEDDYSFDIKQSIGKINIDNKTASSFVSNSNGQNLVKIKGGIATTNISFQQ